MIDGRRSADLGRLKVAELNDWMAKEGISDKEMSEIFGVSIQCVRYWKSGQREFSITNSRLIRLFQKYPRLVREF